MFIVTNDRRIDLPDNELFEEFAARLFVVCPFASSRKVSAALREIDSKSSRPLTSASSVYVIAEGRESEIAVLDIFSTLIVIPLTLLSDRSGF